MSLRFVGRSHVIAWRKDMERRELAPVVGEGRLRFYCPPGPVVPDLQKQSVKLIQDCRVRLY
jgi:hypothetical protein